MIGEKLHQFDVMLCENALSNIRAYMDRPAFASYVQEQLEPPVLAYLVALGDEDITPPPMLLNDYDFNDLAETFEMEFDLPWVAHEPLHRRHIDCVAEIRAALTQECAEQWVQVSSRFAKKLEADSTLLSSGIEIIHDWVREARRLLRALGAVTLLPYPKGSAPTPACPEPPPSTEPGEARIAEEIQDGHDGLVDSITRMEALQLEMRDLLLHQRTIKDFYTTADVATMLGKAEFTVREWCRLGRVRGDKQGSGRGKYQAWVISHEELQRLQREGLLPVHRS